MLFNSLALLLEFTTFIAWWEALAVGVALTILLYSLTPPPPAYWEVKLPNTLYLYLQWSWLGYTRLSSAFWPFFLIYNPILFGVDYRLQEGSFTAASWVTIHLICLMPLIYWTGAVWRCSAHCTARYWAVLARLATIAAFADLALRWVIYRYYPNILFNCQQMIAQFGDC